MPPTLATGCDSGCMTMRTASTECRCTWRLPARHARSTTSCGFSPIVERRSLIPARRQRHCVPLACSSRRSGSTDSALRHRERSRFQRATRRLEIDFTAPSFVSPELLQIQYRLDGFDSEWQDAGGQRQATYMNLPPGDFQFQVVAVDREGRSDSSRRHAGVPNRAGVLSDVLVRHHVRHSRARIRYRNMAPEDPTGAGSGSISC